MVENTGTQIAVGVVRLWPVSLTAARKGARRGPAAPRGLFASIPGRSLDLLNDDDVDECRFRFHNQTELFAESC